jgi:hypothetical protein
LKKAKKCLFVSFQLIFFSVYGKEKQRTLDSGKEDSCGRPNDQSMGGESSWIKTFFNHLDST